MALKKITNLPDGHQSEYIKISEIKINKLEVSLSIDLYKSKVDRDAGNAPSIKNHSQKLLISIITSEDLLGNILNQIKDYSFLASSTDADIYAEAYVYLKSLPEFSDAEDC